MGKNSQQSAQPGTVPDLVGQASCLSLTGWKPVPPANRDSPLKWPGDGDCPGFGGTGILPVSHRLEACATSKKITFILLTACLLLTVFIGCKKEEIAPPPPAPAKKVAAPVQAVMTAVKKEEYVYESAGKRDPFKPFVELEKKEVSTRVASTAPMTPLQAFDLSELRLVGVIILPGKKVAMIEDPTGKGYNVKEGTLIGTSDGKVVEILKDEVVVEERYRDEMGKTRTRKASIRIPREQGEEGR